MKQTALIILFLTVSIILPAQQKTNVILFLVDDLGHADFSGTGSELYETPNIDSFSESGMHFTNAYVCHPRCVPSRYGLQTGKFPARSQVPGGGKLKGKDVTIGEAFQDAGYTTFFAGKWHLGKDESGWPQNHGYDYNVGGCAAGAPISYFFPYNENKGRNSGNHKEIVGLESGKEGEYLTDRLTDETVSFIRKNKDKPFFAMLSHYGVHTPFQAKQDIQNKYADKIKGLEYTGPEFIAKDGTTKMRQDNAIYAAMIESVDESLGKIIETLKQQGIYEHTAIIFTSDHGGLSNRGEDSKRALATSNLPLRAGKGHVYEGGIKVPFMVYWNGNVKAGSVSDQLTVNTDIFPTLLDMADISLKPESHIDGMSMLNALKGKKNVDRTLYWHSPLGRPQSTGDQNCSAIRMGNYKLIDFYDLKKVELYDLSKDPYESNDLLVTKKSITGKLREKLAAWKSEVNAIHK